MASGLHAHHGLDALVTVKVQYEGVTRRTKMQLRDMIPQTLESNIRAFLHLPADADAILERYSDSAGAFVYLDPKDIPIYKQLYRAAKAKSKLKIRVSVRDAPQRTSPKPVTVEDEPEAIITSPVAETPKEEETSDAPQEPQEEQDKQDNSSSAPTLTETPGLRPRRYEFADLPYRSFPDPKGPPMVIAKPTYERFTAARFPYADFAAPDTEVDRVQLTKTTDQSPSFAKLMSDPYLMPKAPRTIPSYVKTTNNLPPAVPPQPAPCAPTCPATTAFAVCCNNCEKTIPDSHYHCSTCDDGDFDLCASCVEQGITCKSDDHWLIKRTIVDGRLIQSTTETIAPKASAMSKRIAATTSTEEFAPQSKLEKSITETAKPEIEVEVKEEPLEDTPLLPKPTFEPLDSRLSCLGLMRTCNCCVQELAEYEFVHCNVCDDYDLCQPCFSKGTHGHHPKHGFSPAVKGVEMPRHIQLKMAPGRNQRHHAICDGCDRNLVGVRHKCLDCPDWDYCSECITTSKVDHPGHRFVPVYEQIDMIYRQQAVHVGICCDGPLCNDNDAYPAYIHGTRFKCAICNDLDFCANCQASPLNCHNVTHPMIMFKTPVRGATIVTTEGERRGHPGRKLGDLAAIRESQVTEASNTINRVQTIVDVKPTEPATIAVSRRKWHTCTKKQVKEPEVETKEEPKEKEVASPRSTESLSAKFVRDTIPDGTILPSNHVFEQTWVLQNKGTTTWPAGCSVKFVGGDYMGLVDSNHPAGISELVSASETTVCYQPLAPGQEFPFTVLLRTPARAGNIVSYWRLTAPSGHKFGDRLWCDVSVRNVKPEVKSETESNVETEAKVETPVEIKQAEESQASSQMIFPKLEKESPVASIHEATASEPTLVEEKVETKTETSDDDWDLSESGFMTDEEYDILDASDEEYLEEQKKKVATK